MKKLTALLFACAVCFALVPLLPGHAHAAGKVAMREKTFVPVDGLNIQYDGYCDGVHLALSVGGVTGMQTGCVGNDIVGSCNEGRIIYATYYTPAAQGGGSATLIYVVNEDHTWTLYACQGSGQVYEVNAGTWTAVKAPPPVAVGGRPSWEK